MKETKMSSRSNFSAAGRWPTRVVNEAGKGMARDGEMCLVTMEAAEYLHASPRTLERWRVDGDGPPYIKLGPGLRAKVLYRLSDLDAWLARFRYNSTSEYRVEHGEEDA